MKHKTLSMVALLLSLLLLLGACGTKSTDTPASDTAEGVETQEDTEETPPAESEKPEDDAENTAETPSKKPTQDREGNAIELSEEVSRVVSFAPAITQVIIDLGQADRLVAVDLQSQAMYPEVAALTAFDMLAPEPEQMIQLEPDLVLVSNLSAQGGDSPFTSVQEAGITVAGIGSADSLDAIRKDIQFIADCLGQSAQGAAIVDKMDADVEAIREIGATIEDKKTVYFEISAMPEPYSFGKGVFLNELLEIIGAENIFADQEYWLPVNEENVVQDNPDVILTNVEYIEDPIGEILGREGWQSITAIAEEAVYSIDANASSQPNHHVVDALQQMAAAVYPEQFGQ